jgi:hypothetical protein
VSNQSMMPVTFTWGDGFAFPNEDEYPEIVVRTGGTRSFGFYGHVNAKYVLEPHVPDLFSVELIPQGGRLFEVKLTGRARGACWLSIYDQESFDNSVGDVYVRVYPRKTLYVNLFIVQDGTGLLPRTSLASAAARLKDANTFLKPQTGITLRTHVLNGFTISQDASSQPMMSSDGGDAIWAELIEKASVFDSSDKHLNLYFLRRWGARDVCFGGRCDKDVIGVANSIGGRHCIVEDLMDPPLFTMLIAHELMHSIGMTHNDRRGSEALMYSTNEGGWNIYSEDVVEVRGEP